jgi:hypothetical protein
MKPGVSQNFDSFNSEFTGNRAIVLKNNSTVPLQLNTTLMIPRDIASSTLAGLWGEYCVYLDEFRSYPDPNDLNPVTKIPNLRPGQPNIGRGNVNCAHKAWETTAYPIIKWGVGDNGLGLNVPPGSCAVIGGYTILTVGTSPSTHINNRENTFQVTIASSTNAATSLRQPRLDHYFRGDGVTKQSTRLEPWKNNTNHDWHLIGATTYAVDYKPTSIDKVDAACIYIYSVSGEIRKKICNDQYPTNGNGSFTLPTEIIKPGESIGAQASNTGAAKRSWGWAIWLHVW